MNNFKIGDVVERLDADFLHLVGPGPHVVTGVYNTDWLQINSWCDGSGNTYPWGAKYFTLVDGGDDELPPAPESVRYYNSYIVGHNDQHLILDGHDTSHPGMNLMYLGIVPRTGSTRADKEIGINMDADTALQLAHDLNRMANEIKRKEKQHG